MVVKRDGREVMFDSNKVRHAINKANEEVIGVDKVTDGYIDQIISYIEANCKGNIKVEDIQDIIEQQLVKNNKYTLAKRYIIYRYQRELRRKSNTTDDSILKLIGDKNEDLRDDNSNKESTMASTQRDLIAGEVSKDLTNRVLLPENIAAAHHDGILHFHDQDYFLQKIFNCCLINISDMLANGTVLNGKMIESPKSFQVACTVATQIMAAVASNQYGGQSIEIRHLAKYVRVSYEKYLSKLTKKYSGKYSEEDIEELALDRTKDEISAGVQTIQYQINTLMTTNG